jgi:DUF1365 family protein
MVKSFFYPTACLPRLDEKEEVDFRTVHAFLLPAIVWHKRFRKANHELKSKVFYLGVDIDQLDKINLGILSYNKFNLLNFLDRDHGDRKGGNLRQWINEILDKYNLPQAKHRIILLSQPRYLGYLFNPVSFWFCFDEKHQLKAVLAEVNNTFGETHSYILYKDDKETIHFNDKIITKKQMHVSPFFLVKGKYEFKFDFREKTIAVFLNYYDSTKVSNKTLALKTTVSGKKIALTKKNLLVCFFSYPFQTIKVITLIHYHALCLFIKKIKYNKKPLKPKNNLS